MKNKARLLCAMLACGMCLFITGCGKAGTNSSDSKDNSKLSGNLTISAAASLKESMADIEKEFKAEYPDINLTFNFGASGSLQQQIEQGAPCDVFISAGVTQMNALEDKNLLLENTKKDLVKNSLVLVAPEGSSLSGMSDLTSPSINKIAVGEPSSVPAGKYADEVFASMGIKDAIKDKLVFAKDVKEVLVWTVSGNADAGFVYKSDALSNNKAKIIEEIPDSYHSPITYPAAVIKDSKNIEAAKTFENFLFTGKCGEIFTKYGYSLV